MPCQSMTTLIRLKVSKVSSIKQNKQAHQCCSGVPWISFWVSQQIKKKIFFRKWCCHGVFDLACWIERISLTVIVFSNDQNSVVFFMPPHQFFYNMLLSSDLCIHVAESFAYSYFPQIKQPGLTEETDVSVNYWHKGGFEHSASVHTVHTVHSSIQIDYNSLYCIIDLLNSSFHDMNVMIFHLLF